MDLRTCCPFCGEPCRVTFIELFDGAVEIQQAVAPCSEKDLKNEI